MVVIGPHSVVLGSLSLSNGTCHTSAGQDVLLHTWRYGTKLLGWSVRKEKGGRGETYLGQNSMKVTKDWMLLLMLMHSENSPSFPKSCVVECDVSIPYTYKHTFALPDIILHGNSGDQWSLPCSAICRFGSAPSSLRILLSAPLSPFQPQVMGTLVCGGTRV